MSLNSRLTTLQFKKIRPNGIEQGKPLWIFVRVQNRCRKHKSTLKSSTEGRGMFRGLGLFHPIFDQFIEHFNNPPPEYRTASSTDDVDILMPSTDEAFSFIIVLSSPVGLGGCGHTARVHTVLPAAVSSLDARCTLLIVVKGSRCSRYRLLRTHMLEKSD